MSTELSPNCSVAAEKVSIVSKFLIITKIVRDCHPIFSEKELHSVFFHIFPVFASFSWFNSRGISFLDWFFSIPQSNTGKNVSISTYKFLLQQKPPFEQCENINLRLTRLNKSVFSYETFSNSARLCTLCSFLSFTVASGNCTQP